MAAAPLSLQVQVPSYAKDRSRLATRVTRPVHCAWGHGIELCEGDM